jgi:cell division control protein 24
MGDPLSVAASIAGLLSLAGQLYSVLDQVITGFRDAPSLARTVHAEVSMWRGTLVSLQQLLSGPAFSVSRASLIPADHIIVCFTDAVLLFSELESVILPLTDARVASPTSRARWARQRSRLLTLITRLQWHKSTLVLQLAILQWFV